MKITFCFIENKLLEGQEWNEERLIKDNCIILIERLDWIVLVAVVMA